MKDLLLAMIKPLVSEPEAVKVECVSSEGDDLKVYRLIVESQDMGKVIGKHGRVINAIRRIVRVASTKQGIKTVVEIG